MIFGFNTDVAGKDANYHVQTEDRGAKNPVIDSIIYVGGRIVDRLQTPYVLEEKTSAEIEAMVRTQHRELIEAIRSGSFVPSNHTAAPVSSPSGYSIQLLNHDNIEKDGQLCVELAVWNRATRGPLARGTLDARWSTPGGETQTAQSQTDEYGTAMFFFPAPQDALEITFLVCAQGPEGREVAKFLVRGNACNIATNAD